MDDLHEGDLMSDSRKPHFRLDPGISLGHIISAAPTLVLAIWLLSGWATKTDSTASSMKEYQEGTTKQIANMRDSFSLDFKSFRSDVSVQINELKVNNEKQSSIIRADIAALPTIQAVLGEVTRRLDQADSRADAQSRRLDAVQATGIQTQADITAILRAKPK